MKTSSRALKTQPQTLNRLPLVQQKAWLPCNRLDFKDPLKCLEQLRRVILTISGTTILNKIYQKLRPQSPPPPPPHTASPKSNGKMPLFGLSGGLILELGIEKVCFSILFCSFQDCSLHKDFSCIQAIALYSQASHALNLRQGY